jgi:DNA-binding NtrC family response regulator
LLIISDSGDHLSRLRSSLSGSNVEITGALSQEEIDQAYRRRHDLAVVDVGPGDLSEILKSLRSSRVHAETTVLVEASRLSGGEHQLAGVLPQYRAMPCSPSELVTLVRHRTGFATQHEKRRLL